MFLDFFFFLLKLCLKNIFSGAEGMAQQLKVLSALSEDPDLIASTHMIAYNICN